MFGGRDGGRAFRSVEPHLYDTGQMMLGTVTDNILSQSMSPRDQCFLVPPAAQQPRKLYKKVPGSKYCNTVACLI